MAVGQDQEALNALALHQQALWTRAQALSIGMSHRMIRYRVSSGLWRHHGHGVFGPPGVGWPHCRRLWRARLVCGPSSVVSHEAAATLLGFRAYGGEPVVVTRPHGQWSRVQGVTVHQLDDLLEDHISEFQGLAITSVERTIVDLAATSRRSRLELAIEEELARGHTSLESVATVVGQVARRGKPGVARLSGILDDQIGARPSASFLERSMGRLLQSIPGLDHQCEVPLPGRGAISGRVDFAIPSCRVIIEVDGRRWHERRRDMIRDRDRDNEAAAAGWVTLRFMWEHLTSDPAGVRSAILATCERRNRSAA